MNPHASHLAASVSLPSTSSLLDVVASLKSVSDASHIAVEKNILSALTPSTAVVSSPTTTVTSQQQNSTKLTTSKGLYITKNGSSQRLHYFYEDS
jgi:hypothetical protein